MDTMTTTERLYDTHPDAARHLAQKLHIKKEDIEMVRKFYLADSQSANDDERAITARVSTPDIDRDGEIILSEGIDTTEYVKNGVLIWAHDYKIPPLGRSVWPPRIDKSGMVCKFQFAKTQFADEVYQLYRDGYMKAFSIGFIPVEYDKATKTHKRISLLEISCVPVPANQNALVMEAYQKGIIKSASLKKDFGIEDAPAVEPEPVAEPIVESVPETVAPDLAPEVKEAEAPVLEPTPIEPPEVKADGPGYGLIIKISADIKEFSAQLEAAKVALVEVLRLKELVESLIPDPAPVDPPATFADLKAFMSEICIQLSDIKAAIVQPVAPVSASVETVPVVELPEPVKSMTPAEFKAAVAEAVKGIDLGDIVKKQTTLALAKLKGKVE